MPWEKNCIISSFYIKPQHLCSGGNLAKDCLISSFYIKPQPKSNCADHYTIVLYRLSTSNHNLPLHSFCSVLIVLYRLSTSNHNPSRATSQASWIVLYRLSTSNHNPLAQSTHGSWIVLYRLSTSNHNRAHTLPRLTRLSYIVFLHQTTTSRSLFSNGQPLSYIVFLHQTTTVWRDHWGGILLSYIVFLHQTTTITYERTKIKKLSYIVFLHQTTTRRTNDWIYPDCLISSFYIKPQHKVIGWRHWLIVLYRLSTSNHNLGLMIDYWLLLSYIVFLHQTTTLLIYSSDYQSVLSYLKQ